MEPVRWGVVGVAAHFIKRVLLPLKRSSFVHLYAVASRSAEKAQATALKFGIDRWYSSYEELLEDDRIEAVFIPLPNHLHHQWIKKSADAGKHILCEKPLGMSAEQTFESFSYAQKKGVLLMEAFMYRFHPQWQRALELVQTREIGSVQTIHTAFGYHLKDPHNIRNRVEFGGGALRDIGCYAVSLSRFLLEAEPERVICLLHDDPDFKIDILSSGIVDFGSARSLFSVGTQISPHQRVDIYGSGGIITIHVPFNAYEDAPVRLSVHTDVGERELLFDRANQYLLEFEAFSRAIREKNPAPLPPEDAINNQSALDALFRSAETRNWENVERCGSLL